MNKKITFSPHILSLAAIFVLGSGIIGFPLKGADEFNFTAYLVALLVMVGLYFIVSAVWERVEVTPYSSKGAKLIYSLAVLVIGIFALFCGADAFSDITNFVSKIILPNTPKFFITVILGLVVVYFSSRPKSGILKFSLVAAVLIVAVILFFFIAPADKFDLRNIFIFCVPSFKNLTNQIKPYLINPVLHCLILPIFLKLTIGKTGTKYAGLGILVGGVLLGLCILAPILLFGANVAGGLEFPFSSAVSTVTVGRLFTRLDGFAYFAYFVCSVIKITVCVSVCFKGISKIKELL